MRPDTLGDFRITPWHIQLIERFFTGGAVRVGQRHMTLIDHIGTVVPVPAIHALVIEDVVPHHLAAIARQRERQTATARFADRQTIILGFAVFTGGVALGGCQEICWKGSCPVGGVHLKVISVGIFFEQLQLPCRHLVSVLICIACSNAQAWFFIGKRVRPCPVARHHTGRDFQTTVVRRNSACRVAGDNRTKLRELAAQVRCGKALIGHRRPRQSDGHQAYRIRINLHDLLHSDG
ncbi:hypothetical protein D3C76_1244670 [compost metagenome]